MRSGRVAFGLAVALLGIVHLVFGAEVARMFIFPEALGGRDLLGRAAGAVLLACGVLVARGTWRGREAAVGLVGLVLLSVATLHLQRALLSGTFGGAWLGVLKWMALAGGAMSVAQSMPAWPPRPRFDRMVARGASAGTWAMAALMIGSGILHLRYVDFVVGMMPTWMPWREFWAYFTALTLAAGGLGILVKPVARAAAGLSSAMFLGFFVLVHVPRTLANPSASTGWAELGESLSYAAICLVLMGGQRPRR